MYPFLRNKAIFDQFGYSGGNSGTSDGSEQDYLPSSQFNDPSLDLPVQGQDPQSPYAAALFRQSFTPDATTEQNLRDLYHPQTSAQERLNKLLDSFPEEEKPSFARKFAAMAVGIGGRGGIKDEQAILDEPNNSAIERWKTQAVPFQQAANNERQNNINERTLAQQTIAARQNQQKIDDARAKNEAAGQVATTRAEAYAFAKEHPTWKIDFSGPEILAVSPDGKQTARLGKTGHLDDRTKIELQNAGKVEAAKALGTSRETVAGITTDPRRIYNMPDPNFPNDPSKTIPYRINPTTNELEPLQVRGAGGTTKPATGGLTRPGTTGGKSTTQPGNIQAIQTMTKQTLGALDDIISEKGELNSNVASVVGVHRYNPLTWFGGTPATSYVTANNSIKRLHDMLVLDLIGEMKAQSRTGATGFGALSGPELSILENSATKLDPSMPEADFIAELKRIRSYLNKIVQPPDQFTPVTTPKVMSPQDYIDKYSGGKK